MSSDSPTPALPDLPEKLAHKGSPLPVRFTGSPPDIPTDGVVRMQYWDEAARTTRAMTRLGLFWVLAIVSIAIPFLHFCLVPGLFVVGPIAAWLAYRSKAVVLGGVGWCPHCAKPVVVEKYPDEWPVQAQCGACGAWSSVEKLPEPAVEGEPL